MNLINKYRKSWQLITEVVIVSLWIQLAVWTVSLPRILEIIESRPRKSIPKKEIERMLKTIDALFIVNKIIIRRNCLKRNLLYYYFLVTSGVTQITLHIGIRKPGRKLDGHCWLTLDGEVYLDTESNVSQYTVMYSRGV